MGNRKRGWNGVTSCLRRSGAGDSETRARLPVRKPPQRRLCSGTIGRRGEIATERVNK